MISCGAMHAPPGSALKPHNQPLRPTQLTQPVQLLHRPPNETHPTTPSTGAASAPAGTSARPGSNLQAGAAQYRCSRRTCRHICVLPRPAAPTSCRQQGQHAHAGRAAQEAANKSLGMGHLLGRKLHNQPPPTSTKGLGRQSTMQQDGRCQRSSRCRSEALSSDQRQPQKQQAGKQASKQMLQ